MRLGKPLEHLQAALKASQSANLSQRSLERFTAVARQLSYAGYLALDGVVWAQSIKFIHLHADKADKALKASLRFWFVGILCGLGNGLLKVGISYLCNSDGY
jgi:peroxin-11B